MFHGRCTLSTFLRTLPTQSEYIFPNQGRRASLDACISTHDIGAQCHGTQGTFLVSGDAHRSLSIYWGLREINTFHRGFGTPGIIVGYVVDMTKMQWGEAARGTFGEQYFLGSLDEFGTAMLKVCENYDLESSLAKVAPSEHTALLQACAERVLERWNKRATETWCNYCGRGGSTLMKCGGCQGPKVSYCCREHHISDRPLHKHTCNPKKKKIAQ